MKKYLAVVVIFLFISVSVISSTGMVFNDDTTPPVTTHALDPPEPNGDNGWYISNVIVTLNATDDMSGVNATYFRINNGTWETYTESFVIQTDGYYTIEYYSVDNTGNEEEVKSASLLIDQTVPKMQYLSWEFDDLDIVITEVSKDAMSGMDRVEFYYDDVLQETVVGPGPNYSRVAAHPDLFLIEAVGYDKAGNNFSHSILFHSPAYFKVMGIFRNPEFSATCVRFDAVLIFCGYYGTPYVPYLFGGICRGEKLMFILNFKSGFIGESFIRATFVDNVS